MPRIIVDREEKQQAMETVAFAIVAPMLFVLLFSIMQLSYVMYEHAVIEHNISEASWSFSDADMKKYKGDYGTLIKNRVKQACPTLNEAEIIVTDASLEKYTTTVTHVLRQHDIDTYGLGQMQNITTKLIVRAHISYRVQPLVPLTASTGVDFRYTLGKNLTLAKKCEVS